MAGERIAELLNFAQTEAREILNWWMCHARDEATGGFYGRVAFDGTLENSADRHVVLASRLVWTFSAAYRLFGDAAYLAEAEYYYNYFINTFWDKEHGGAYLCVSPSGRPVNERKETYGQSFTLYALSEFARATGSPAAKEKADEMFSLLEDKVYDSSRGGFVESMSRSFGRDADAGKATVNHMDGSFTMNTTLHLLESYTNYFAMNKTLIARAAAARLLDIMSNKVLGDDFRFALFFDDAFKRIDTLQSYGHDIEGSWLMYETAQILQEPSAIARVRDISINMARAVLNGGIDLADGAVLNEYDYQTRHNDNLKGWWQQAEGVVGFLNAYELSGDHAMLDACVRVKDFILRHIKDAEYGEWFSSAGAKAKTTDKVNGWKCPYHNGRMCFELITRCR